MITKHGKLVRLQGKDNFSGTPEAVESKIRVLADWIQHPGA